MGVRSSLPASGETRFYSAQMHIFYSSNATSDILIPFTAVSTPISSTSVDMSPKSVLDSILMNSEIPVSASSPQSLGIGVTEHDSLLRKLVPASVIPMCATKSDRDRAIADAAEMTVGGHRPCLRSAKRKVMFYNSLACAMHVLLFVSNLVLFIYHSNKTFFSKFLMSDDLATVFGLISLVSHVTYVVIARSKERNKEKASQLSVEMYEATHALTIAGRPLPVERRLADAKLLGM